MISCQVLQGFSGLCAHRLRCPRIRPEDECQTLELTLEDECNDCRLILYYTVYERTNVITRRAVLENCNDKPLVIRRLMSMMVDIPDRGFRLVTFDGGWIKEAHRHERPLQYGIYINSSTTGAGSNRHNPGFLLAEQVATQEHGYVYGFNLGLQRQPL